MQINCYDMRGVNAKVQNSMLDMLLSIKLFHKNSRLGNEKNIVFSFKLNSDQIKSLMSVTFLEVMINRIDMRSVYSLVIHFPTHEFI